ncbi:hypothetical protein EDC04DRAFT_2603672 [Pisolithus marmoratus]|nr:hypothetical protein EDC04DRAFT_2603672 [Pisolithus marmoratus]
MDWCHSLCLTWLLCHPLCGGFSKMGEGASGVKNSPHWIIWTLSPSQKSCQAGAHSSRGSRVGLSCQGGVSWVWEAHVLWGSRGQAWRVLLPNWPQLMCCALEQVWRDNYWSSGSLGNNEKAMYKWLSKQGTKVWTRRSKAGHQSGVHMHYYWKIISNPERQRRRQFYRKVMGGSKKRVWVTVDDDSEAEVGGAGIPSPSATQHSVGGPSEQTIDVKFGPTLTVPDAHRGCRTCTKPGPWVSKTERSQGDSNRDREGQLKTAEEYLKHNLVEDVMRLGVYLKKRERELKNDGKDVDMSVKKGYMILAHECGLSKHA